MRKVGILIIFGMVLLYSGSFLFALVSALLLLAPLCLAYAIYTLLLRIPLFPALNLTSLFICIGIGADDIFVFLEATDRAIRNAPYASITTITERVLRDAGAATLVTSVTTAGAFLACATSPITSIKCFGLFCALVVSCDWLLMVTGVPAAVALYRQYIAHCSRAFCGGRCPLNAPLVGGVFLRRAGPGACAVRAPRSNHHLGGLPRSHRPDAPPHGEDSG